MRRILRRVGCAGGGWSVFTHDSVPTSRIVAMDQTARSWASLSRSAREAQHKIRARREAARLSEEQPEGKMPPQPGPGATDPRLSAFSAAEDDPHVAQLTTASGDNSDVELLAEGDQYEEDAAYAADTQSPAGGHPRQLQRGVAAAAGAPGGEHDAPVPAAGAATLSGRRAATAAGTLPAAPVAAGGQPASTRSSGAGGQPAGAAAAPAPSKPKPGAAAAGTSTPAIAPQQAAAPASSTAAPRAPTAGTGMAALVPAAAQSNNSGAPPRKKAARTPRKKQAAGASAPSADQQESEPVDPADLNNPKLQALSAVERAALVSIIQALPPVRYTTEKHTRKHFSAVWKTPLDRCVPGMGI